MAEPLQTYSQAGALGTGHIAGNIPGFASRKPEAVGAASIWLLSLS